MFVQNIKNKVPIHLLTLHLVQTKPINNGCSSVNCFLSFPHDKQDSVKDGKLDLRVQLNETMDHCTHTLTMSKYLQTIPIPMIFYLYGHLSKYPKSSFLNFYSNTSF